jgi:isoquinoline 1-oxidoreductase beta subunit
VAVAGGIAIGYKLYPKVDNNGLEGYLTDNQQAITPYVIIGKQGITIITPRAEMGQGIHSTLAVLVAEELDVPITDIRVEHGPASNLYGNDVMVPVQRPKNLKNRIKKFLLKDPARDSRQLTGAQASIRDGFIKMRKAGAAARYILMAAAAKKWGTSIESLSTSDGTILHPDGQSLSYVEAAQFAVNIKPPENVKLKTRSEWKYLGKSQPRVDMVSKCTGKALYAIDIKLPDMLYGAARMNPHLGSSMISFDADQALQMRGVKRVVPLKNGIVVIATNTWYAIEAAKTVEVNWSKPIYPATTKEHYKAIKQAITKQPHSQLRNDGNVELNFESADKIAGEYQVPYLAHANMEPLNAVAWYHGKHLDIWAGTQWPTNARLLGSDVLGIDIDKVKVHTNYMGCGFGRRLEIDFIETAIHAAQALKGTPVKVTWSREEDMTHDVYRPMSMAKFTAYLQNGQLLSLNLKLASISLWTSYSTRGITNNQDNPQRNTTITMGAVEQPYNIPNYRVTGYRATNLLPAGWLRSVGESQNSFFHESIMDEVAHSCNVDPLEWRLNLITHSPSRTVLTELGRISGWEEELPEGHSRGIAYVLSSGAATAQVIEIINSSSGIEIAKVFAVVDVGIALDPRNIEAQIKSGVIFGLSAAINGEITISDGKVDQTNFHNYSPLRIYQVPTIQVSIIQSGSEIYGVGESGTAAVAPALGNAIFAATGKRIRELPLERHVHFSWRNRSQINS